MTACEDGPLLLRGPFELLTQDGRTIDPGRATVALCRCGRSASKPFCDGSHKATGFRAPSEPGGPVDGPARTGGAPGGTEDVPIPAGDTRGRGGDGSGGTAG
ncbi:CDGSH iron-sulfur domain-containing protein [Streptosporangium sp. DT93]|uniref:CDGSH iron-sulfur domain-containing protein n=1 Tax=Streptosporangium sp. DT93 TaxID=3393428 RepID=UPI003CF0EB37